LADFLPSHAVVVVERMEGKFLLIKSHVCGGKSSSTESTLDWHEENENRHAQQARVLDLCEYQVSGNGSAKRSHPEVVSETHQPIKATDVIGHEIDCLSGNAIAHRVLGEEQNLFGL